MDANSLYGLRDEYRMDYAEKQEHECHADSERLVEPKSGGEGRMSKPKPKYAIINTTDAPCFYHVAELVDGKYYYMARKDRPHLRQFDGMTPERPTSMGEFGFAVLHRTGRVYFRKIADSIATYEDGVPRRWPGTDETFDWPSVVVRRKRKAA